MNDTLLVYLRLVFKTIKWLVVCVLGLSLLFVLFVFSMFYIVDPIMYSITGTGEKLGNGYAIHAIEKNRDDKKNRYEIEYKPSIWSPNWIMVTDFSISELEYSSNYIYSKSVKNNYWIVEKNSTLGEGGRFPFRVIGPLDSLQFIHIKDSLSVNDVILGRWSLNKEYEE